MGAATTLLIHRETSKASESYQKNDGRTTPYYPVMHGYTLQKQWFVTDTSVMATFPYCTIQGVRLPTAHTPFLEWVVFPSSKAKLFRDLPTRTTLR